MGKIIVVGSGWSGAVIAREIAEKLNRKVTIIEKRNHIGGNMYDEYDEHNILIQRYGPHYFCTNQYDVVEYVTQYTDLYEHVFKTRTFIDEKYIFCPYNFQTIIDLVGAKQASILFKKFRNKFGEQRTVSMYEIIRCDDTEIVSLANLLFEKVYRNYVAKMWGHTPEELDYSIVDRTPLILDFSDRKGSLDFYFMPVKGYTNLFKEMLSHDNICVELNTNAIDHIKLNEEKKIVYYDDEVVECLIFTGPIDELFGMKYGALPYRTLDIKYDYYEVDSMLPCEVVYYPQADGYTRRTEFKKQMLDESVCKGTVVATEYPMEYKANRLAENEPFYPVLTEDSRAIYSKYLQFSKEYSNLFLLGRLADFRYYDMDAAIKHALDYFDVVKNYLNG